MLKKLVSVILVSMLLVGNVPLSVSAAGSWDGTVASGFQSGSGIRTDPYIIATPEQLALFRNMVNDGQSDICAKVVNDIDLGNKSWTPIGLTQDGYTGIFDGGGRAMKNMFLDSLSDPITVRQYNDTLVSIAVAGLFGVIGSGGTVKYVDVSGSISGSLSKSTPIYVGSLVGSNFGTVEECYSTCSIDGLTITSNNYIGIGGIAGESDVGSVIRNCFNVGSINAVLKMNNKQSDNNYIGGIVGYNNKGEVYNCYSAAPINISTNSDKLYLGGVVGLTVEGKLVTNSYYDRDVCTAASYVAGRDYNVIKKAFNPAGCSPKSTTEMKTQAFVSTLGNAFAYDSANQNKGYPILAVMTYGQQIAYSPWAEKELTDPANQAIYERLFPYDLYNKDLRKPITRAEFAAVAIQLYEEMGGKVLDPSKLNNPFYDTSSDAVIKAASVGIVAGISATEFNPYAPISRQDMCTMLTRVYKALNLPEWTLAADGNFALDYSGVSRFADDTKISDYAKPSVYFLVKCGVVSGLTSTEFGPRNIDSAEQSLGYANASREQAAIVAIRMFKYLGD